MKLAPIVLFTYNRLEHTKRTVEALKVNFLAQDSKLYIFSDGPKNEDDRLKIEKLRNYLKTVSGFKSVKIFENEENKGLAPSLIAGINRIFENYEKIIVFEDDILSSPYTLEFLNDCLDIYENDANVGMIHGHIEKIKDLPPLFFDKKAGCWAWATWKRAWNEINFDGQYLLDEIRKAHKENEFDLEGAYPYIKMLQKQIMGKNSSWAIRVYASFFLKDILTLYPGKSYAQHIGYDLGTHYKTFGKPTEIDGNIEATQNVATRIDVKEDFDAVRKTKQFFRKRRKYSPYFFKMEILRRWNKLKSKYFS